MVTPGTGPTASAGQKGRRPELHGNGSRLPAMDELPEVVRRRREGAGANVTEHSPERPASGKRDETGDASRNAVSGLGTCCVGRVGLAVGGPEFYGLPWPDNSVSVKLTGGDCRCRLKRSVTSRLWPGARSPFGRNSRR